MLFVVWGLLVEGFVLFFVVGLIVSLLGLRVCGSGGLDGRLALKHCASW